MWAVEELEADVKSALLALRLVGVGFFIGGSIALGAWLGFLLDKKLETRFPLFMILGLLLGIAVAGYGVYQMLLPIFTTKDGNDQ